MMDNAQLQRLLKPIKPELKRFETLEAKLLQNDSKLIYGISKHLLLSRGKRLRPAFLFLTGKVTEYKSRHLVEAALAVEMIHTATLLHDDVIDQSGTRRGQKTVNAQWNNLISVLMGDYFFSKAFTLLVKTGSLEMLKQVSIATERVATGELRQIEEAFNHELSEKEYLKIISDKTASLFQACSMSAPLLSGAPKKMVNKLAKFGEYTGCAFQIADDLLDLVGDFKKTGKKPGNDIIQGKITLPLIYSLGKSQASTRKSIIKILNNGIEEKGFQRVLDFVDTTGGIEYARKRANSIADQALSYIQPFQSNPYYNTLEELATFAIDREL